MTLFVPGSGDLNRPIRRALELAVEAVLPVRDGAVADYIPELAKADPAEQVGQIGSGGGAPGDGQRQGDIGGEGQVVDELAILMHHPDAAAGQGDIVAAQRADLAVKKRQAAGRGHQFSIAQL